MFCIIVQGNQSLLPDSLSFLTMKTTEKRSYAHFIFECSLESRQMNRPLCFFVLQMLEYICQIHVTCIVIFLLQGEDNIEYFLGLTPSGIIVLRNRTKVGNYFW